MIIPLKKEQKERTKLKCPTCRQTTAWQDNPHRPFCSNRCRMLDLGCWADEEYRVPSEDQTGVDVSEENLE